MSPLSWLWSYFVGKRHWWLEGFRDWFASSTLSSQKTLSLRNDHLGSLFQMHWPFSSLVFAIRSHGNMLGELYRDRASELWVSLESLEFNPSWDTAQYSIQSWHCLSSPHQFTPVGPSLGEGRVPSENSSLVEAMQIHVLALPHSHCATSSQQLVSLGLHLPIRKELA